MAQVALYLDTHAPRCADFDGLEILNAPNPATCALDPAAAIQLRPGTQSRARETTAPVRRDCRDEIACAEHLKVMTAIRRSGRCDTRDLKARR